MNKLLSRYPRDQWQGATVKASHKTGRADDPFVYLCRVTSIPKESPFVRVTVDTQYGPVTKIIHCGKLEVVKFRDGL